MSKVKHLLDFVVFDREKYMWPRPYYNNNILLLCVDIILL